MTITITDEMVEAGAKALVFEQSSGLCEFGKVCSMCDCFAAGDNGRMKDGYALSHARSVLEAALEGVTIPTCTDESKYGNMTETQELCPFPVGSKPYWMSEDQWEPCSCIYLKNHDGPCKCSHLIKES